MRLKPRPEDFVVTESWRFDDDAQGAWRVYLMDKQKLSTFDAIARIRERFGLKPEALGWVERLPAPLHAPKAADAREA